jgi:hypothetical protein
MNFELEYSATECGDCVAAADEVGEFDVYPIQQNLGIKDCSENALHLANADCVGIAFTQ